MDTRTGEFHNPPASPEELKKFKELFDKGDGITFEKGEVINIKGHDFVVDRVDVAIHRLVLKSNKRIKYEKNKDSDN